MYSLPLELRRMIYKLVLFPEYEKIPVTRKQPVPPSRGGDESFDQFPERIDLILCRVCKLFNQEVRQMFYSDTLFDTLICDYPCLWGRGYVFRGKAKYGLIQKLSVQLHHEWFTTYGWLTRNIDDDYVPHPDNYDSYPETPFSNLMFGYDSLREIRLWCTDSDLETVYTSSFTKQMPLPWTVHSPTCRTLTTRVMVLTLEQTRNKMAHDHKNPTSSYPIYIGGQNQYVRLVVDPEHRRRQPGVKMSG